MGSVRSKSQLRDYVRANYGWFLYIVAFAAFYAVYVRDSDNMRYHTLSFIGILFAIFMLFKNIRTVTRKKI